MSDGETKLADTTGKFAQVVSDGRKVADLEWVSGRILLSNRRMILASNEGKRTLPLSEVRTVKRSNQALAQVSGYLSVQVGTDVMLIAPSDEAEFEAELYSALLDDEVVLVKHPAVEGGVVQDTAWQKSQVKVDDDVVNLGTSDGRFIEIELADVGSVEQEERSVLDSERQVLEVEHTVEGTSVETHLSGRTRHVGILSGLLRRAGNTDTDVDLTQEENEVLMALYSGVSPFEIPDFVGMEVEEVEAVFERLAEKGVVEPVGTRREVALQARGRNIASQVMGEE